MTDNRADPVLIADGRYRVVDRLGQGGISIVYRVQDTWFDRVCALKLLNSDRSQSGRAEKTKTRFQQEARLMAALDHVNLLTTLDMGEHEGIPFFVTKLCEGGNLATYLRRYGQVPPDEAAAIILQALQGLHHAHGMGLVHRDIKPHNLLFEFPVAQGFPLTAQDGRAQAVKLMDFGIARILAMAGRNRLTGTGDTLGTLAYMAPEQRVDPRSCGPQADIYGMGAILYMLCTGRRPFDLTVVRRSEEFMGRIPPLLRSTVETATHPDLAQRYPSAKKMALDLIEILDQLHPDLDTDQLRQQLVDVG